MTDEERDRIRREASDEAKLHARVDALEKGFSSMSAKITWGVGAIWGGAAYLAIKLIDFIAGGGTIK